MVGRGGGEGGWVGGRWGRRIWVGKETGGEGAFGGRKGEVRRAPPLRS